MAVFGFSPHAHGAGVFAKEKRFFTLNPMFWSFEGGDIIAN
jgi:hypothetical protein